MNKDNITTTQTQPLEPLKKLLHTMPKIFNQDPVHVFYFISFHFEILLTFFFFPQIVIPSLHRIFADIAESLDTNNDLILSHQEFKVFFDGYSSSIFDSTKYFVDIVLTGLRAKVPDLTFEGYLFLLLFSPISRFKI